MKIGLLTSGGDTPGMNACLRAIVRIGIGNSHEVVGIKRGYAGLIAGETETLKRHSVSDIIHRGGTVLKTSRSAEFMTDAGLAKAVKTCKDAGLERLIVIGGNGSYAGALTLAKAGVPVLCLPGTIDNDLSYTDYTIGFDTAINTALSAISNIRDTSESHDRTTIIEVMGRECGDIAIFSGMAGGAEIVLIPERPISGKEILSAMERYKSKGKTSNIIIKAEGYDKYSIQGLKDLIEAEVGFDVKSVSLGYVQRGGSPTAFDRILAARLGAAAVFGIEKQNVAFGIRGGKIINVPLEEALEHRPNPNAGSVGLVNLLAN